MIASGRNDAVGGIIASGCNDAVGGLLRAVAMTRLGDYCERVISKALLFHPSLRAVEDGAAIHA